MSHIAREFVSKTDRPLLAKSAQDGSFLDGPQSILHLVDYL